MSLPGKLIVFSAPSGSGKTTIVKHIVATIDNVAFSVSATTRKKRPYEVHAKDYFYLSIETFKLWISMEAFAEWEEVYEGQYYGTLRSEIERLTSCGHNVIFDVDVKGGLSIKKLYPSDTLSVFVKVPSMEILEERLRLRGNDDDESLRSRLAKASHELAYESQFDAVLVNDDLDVALREAEDIVQKFLNLG